MATCWSLSLLSTVAAAWLVTFCFCFSFTNAGDAEVLLEIQNGLNSSFRFNGWNVDNIPYLCYSWEGVSCIGGRVAHLNTSAELAAQKIRGFLSPAIANLTELRQLSLMGIYWIGTLPEQIWELPYIEEIALKNARLNIKFPAQPSPSLRKFALDGANFTSPLPENLPWNNIYSVVVEGSPLQCPLPAALVQKMRTDTYLQCSFAMTTLQIVDDMVCGQIHLNDFPCEYAPLAKRYVSTAPKTSDVLFTTQYKGLWMEFLSHSMNIYGIKSNGQPHRDEYMALHYFPVQERDRGGPWRMNNMNLFPFEAFNWVNDKELHVNSTMKAKDGTGMICTWIYQFDVEGGNIQVSGSSLKFSIVVKNVNYVYQRSMMQLSLMAEYRAPHSAEGGTPINCPPFEAQAVACSSSVANLTFGIDLAGYIPVTTIGLKTSRVELKFAYGVIGEIDGGLLSLHNTKVSAERYLKDLGYPTFIQEYQMLNRTDLLPLAGPASGQSVLILFGLRIPTFSEVRYDPDISLSLIFDAGAPLDASSSATVPTAIGVTAAVIVVAAVVGLTLYLKKERIYRLEKQRVVDRLGTGGILSSPSPNPNATPQPLTPSHANSNWTRARTDTLSTTNT